jgi:hypothetical protein
MPTEVLFVHGTAVRNPLPALDKLRAGFKNLGWQEDSVNAIDWGEAVGVPQIDVSRVLPEGHDRGVALEAAPPLDEAEEHLALWEALIADPTVELSVLAEDDLSGPVKIAPGVAAADVALAESLRRLRLPDEALERSGFIATDVTEAANALAANVVVGAAARALEPNVAAAATSRALVASLITKAADDAEDSGLLPSAAADAGARDALVEAVAGELAAQQVSARLIGDAFVKRKLVLPLVSRVAVAKREVLTDSVCNFGRDVTFYLQHGATIRDIIAEAIRTRRGPERLVLLGHSLGGIAAVDLLADAKEMGGENPLAVDLLVTVGSQAPVLYLMESLSSLSPKEPNKKPFTPWLNIYNPNDLLSFCAERVFNRQAGIHDRPVDAGVPFPLSHSAYWDRPETFELVSRQLGP